MFYIDLYCEKHENIFLSETIRLRVLIFGMLHHLVNLYQVCSNYAPGTKKTRPRGHMLYMGSLGEKCEKVFWSETIRHRVFIIGM